MQGLALQLSTGLERWNDSQPDDKSERYQKYDNRIVLHGKRSSLKSPRLRGGKEPCPRPPWRWWPFPVGHIGRDALVTFGIYDNKRIYSSPNAKHPDQNVGPGVLHHLQIQRETCITASASASISSVVTLSGLYCQVFFELHSHYLVNPENPQRSMIIMCVCSFKS